MKILLGIPKRRRTLLLSSVFAPVCFGILIGNGPSGTQSPTRSDIKIVNKTTTLEVVALRPTDHNLLVIGLTNVSSKDLNGYTVAVNGTRITKDLSSGDRVVPTGQTDELEIPLGASPPDITILAAMFADGSIEGDQAIAAELRERRLGLKKELIRALSILNATLESPDVYAAMALDELESRFSSLSLESATDRPHSAEGSQEARNTLSTEIQILRERRQRHGALMQRQRLLDLKGRIERRIARI